MTFRRFTPNEQLRHSFPEDDKLLAPPHGWRPGGIMWLDENRQPIDKKPFVYDPDCWCEACSNLRNGS